MKFGKGVLKVFHFRVKFWITVWKMFWFLVMILFRAVHAPSHYENCSKR